MSDKWTEKNLPDLTGKTIIITGANSGTGFAATEYMSGRGAHVIMASRNSERLEAAKDKIMGNNSHAKLDTIGLSGFLEKFS